MMITWIVIVLVVALMVGPIMMMRPSPGTARLSRIREQANQRGISIKLRHGQSDTTGAVANRVLYSRKHSDANVKLASKLPGWALVRHGHDHDIHFYREWDWQGDGRPLNSTKARLTQLLERIPQGVYTIESNASGYGIVWDEALRGKDEYGAVTEIDDLLSSFEKILQASVE